MSDSGDLDTITRLTTGPNLVHVRPTVAARVVGWWSPRRVLAALVAGPFMLWGLLTSESATQPLVVLLVLSVATALSVASFVPPPGMSWRSTWGSPCSSVGGILPLGCAIATLVRGQEGAPLLALAFTAFALYQRFGNNGACGVR